VTPEERPPHIPHHQWAPHPPTQQYATPQYPGHQSPSTPIPTPAPVPTSKPWRTALILAVAAVTIVSLIGVAAAVTRNSATPVTSASSPTAQTPVAPTSVNAAPAVTVAPARPPAPPKALTARDWAKIAKNPDARKGESIVVYGRVRQFDSATGTDTFRAEVDGVQHKSSYGYVDYETNTVLTRGGADLGDLVQDDLFKAEVTVIGSLSYDTTLGGTTTVPHLMVNKITVTGSVK
jgi:hypothetical protein